MEDKRGHNVYEYPDCANFNLLFRGCDKESLNFYEVKSERLE
jgi:hypothetical protein